MPDKTELQQMFTMWCKCRKFYFNLSLGLAKFCEQNFKTYLHHRSLLATKINAQENVHLNVITNAVIKKLQKINALDMKSFSTN